MGIPHAVSRTGRTYVAPQCRSHAPRTLLIVFFDTKRRSGPSHRLRPDKSRMKLNKPDAGALRSGLPLCSRLSHAASVASAKVPLCRNPYALFSMSM